MRIFVRILYSRVIFFVERSSAWCVMFCNYRLCHAMHMVLTKIGRSVLCDGASVVFFFDRSVWQDQGESLAGAARGSNVRQK